MIFAAMALENHRSNFWLCSRFGSKIHWGVFFSRGGCYWLFISRDPGRKYSTCVADPETCPDDRCDALEKLSHGLCPQDCAGWWVLSGSRYPVVELPVEFSISQIGYPLAENTGPLHHKLRFFFASP